MGKKSGVWDYFTPDNSTKIKKAICRECKVVVCTSGNTSNLYHLLKKNHRAIHRRFAKKGNKLVECSDNDDHVDDHEMPDAVATSVSSVNGNFIFHTRDVIYVNYSLLM